jgi:methylated-DNA-[protein]-cysteine S-methyltransferase
MDRAQKVYELLCRIPRGKVTTYGELARAVGYKGARAIGRIVHMNPNAPAVPCHRVVMSDGGLGGYALGAEKKIRLLDEEGVRIADNRVVDFERCLHRFD